ncbi:unnamed protein product [Adineta steineri]|uniref:Uncharacterized protein n=2 Tax=Adineta steineri TaxID=433720 RepID=A0A818RMU3_9BILA|nr:unnamed protein product [Adineta steineri]
MFELIEHIQCFFLFAPRGSWSNDSLNIWTFDDKFRATVKGSSNSSNERPILTGMACGLNSTLSIAEGTKKLPPCPVLLLSNSDGVLQVYYYIHKNLPSILRAPEVIKQIQAPNILGTPTSLPQTSNITSLQSSFLPSQSSSANGFSFAKSGPTPTQTPIFTSSPQPKEKSTNNVLNFNQPPAQIPNGSSIDDLSKAINMNISNKPPTSSVQQAPIKSTIRNEQPVYDSKNLFQMVDEFRSRLKLVEKPLSKQSDSSINLDKSLDDSITTLKNMVTSIQKSMQSIKTMTSEHIESITKIEDARHQMKLSQTENLYNLLKDRQLDPWTQLRLDSIKTKYDQLKHDLNVLLQLTHTTIHNKSLSVTDDDIENEDFLPDLEISLNTSGTMKQQIQKRIRELSHKVTETDKDLQNICSKLNRDLSISKTSDKMPVSSDRPFHSLDAQILSHLQANHKNILKINVPPAVTINLSSSSSSSIESKKPSIIEISKPITPSTQSPIPKQPNSPSVDSESYKNIFRIVRASIDLFSGATSPEQLQELSNTAATSPLSATNKSHMTSIHKTPTISKTPTTNLTKTSSINKPLQTTNILQTPAKSMTSPIPTISVTPATPATQPISSNAPMTLQQTKPGTQTPTDLSKFQTTSTSGDSTIRALLNNTVSPPTNTASLPNQPVNASTSNQAVPSTLFGNSSKLGQSASSELASIASTQLSFAATSPSSTITTSVQSTSPTTKPVVPSSPGAFGSKLPFGGTSLNLTSTSSSIPFGSAAATTTTTTTTATSSPFGSAFGSGFSITTTSASSPGPFGTTTSSTSSPFSSSAPSASSPFGGTSTTTTTSAPTTGIFGSSTTTTSSIFGGASTAAVSSAPTTSIFGGATTSTASPFGTAGSTTATSPFGGTPTTSSSSAGGFGASPSVASPFGSGFGTATSTSTASPFGSSFGATSSAPTGSVFGGFGSNSTTPTPTSSTGAPAGGIFGSSTTAAPSTGSSGFGAGPTFGSTFSGFNTQSKSTGSPTGFQFGGFGGSQSSDTTAPQQTFGSFGSTSAASQPSTTFGGSVFGGASAQPTGFSAPATPFGAPSTQSATSPSFTSYRK